MRRARNANGTANAWIAGREQVRGRIAVDVRDASEGRLGDHAAGRAHQRVEREHGRPLLGRDQPVDERLAQGSLDGKDQAPRCQQGERDEEIAGQADDREQRDVHDPAEDQGIGSPAEEAPNPGDGEPAHDLGAGHEGRGQAGDAVGGLVAVQLQQVRLRGIEDVDPGAGREGRGEHQPADRRIAEASVDGTADHRSHRGARTDPRAGVNPRSCMNRKATTNVTPSIAARSTYGTPRLVAWAMTPPDTEPTSMAAPPIVWARPKTPSRWPVKPVAFERVDQPRLGRPGEEREPEAEQDRGDRPAPQRRVQLPHHEVEERGEQQRRGAQQVGELAAAGVGDHPGRDLEDHLPEGEEGVGRECLRVVQAGVEQEERVDAPDERGRERVQQRQQQVGSLDLAGRIGHGPGSGATIRDVQLEDRGDTLELDGTDLREGDGGPIRGVDDLLADHDLALASVLGDPRRNVHRPAEIVAFLEQDRPGVESDMRRGQIRLGGAFHHFQGGQDGASRLAEIEHHAVAQPLDRLAAVVDGGPLDEAGELARQLRRRLVATFVRQSCVPREIEETDRRQVIEGLVEARPAQARSRSSP